MPLPTLLVHGGAGTLPPDSLTPERRAAITDGLRRALEAGMRVLGEGRPALDAVTASVSVLEDDPNFNAGHGAVLTSAGQHELDAALMDGHDARLGAVAGIVGPRNPIEAARLVLERSPHVLLVGQGAIDFLRAQGASFEPPAYFATAERRAALDRMLAETGTADDFDRHGTVGAVALDTNGHLAAATSTGGMTGKRPGRIGDTPIAGAGTWADRAVAVSATGHGESFIRAAAAYQLSARLRWAGQTLAEASADVLAAVTALGGDGGLIALDRDSNVALPFTGRGMYRGLVRAGTDPVTAIYDEPLA